MDFTRREENCGLLGNGIVGILSESINKWERRAPLTPSHCARLLLSGKGRSGVERIIVQPSMKRIHHDAQYKDVGCEISDDLSECGLIVGIKQPKLEMILPDRAYAFFSHTHKAQQENMPLLDKIASIWKICGESRLNRLLTWSGATGSLRNRGRGQSRRRRTTWRGPGARPKRRGHRQRRRGGRRW